ncbi:MAG: ATPase domain-containing protein [Candidatus Altiarchaeota archaeon]|nr:ATPase domain-containing protein [Candidatus Altiarchaeota archaeon]
MLKRVKTGIEGLDALLGGGIPQGHVVLLSGSCGTGKTILSQQFLFTGAREFDDTGIYISLSESKDKMIKNLESFEFFDNNLLESHKIKIVDITQDARLMNLEPLSVKSIMNMIVSIIRDSDAKRVVLDSVTAVCNSLGNERNIRDFLFELGLQLQYLDCTTILISEIPPMKFQYSVFGIEEFIADGVILLTEFEQKGDLLRTLQVVKMRGLGHSRSKNLLEITQKGMELKPIFEL